MFLLLIPILLINTLVELGGNKHTVFTMTVVCVLLAFQLYCLIMQIREYYSEFGDGKI